MSELATVNGKPTMDAIEKVLVGGDLSKLNESQRVAYYDQTCDSLGLNRLTRPFDYITLNGKLQLYARKDCTDQLRKIHSVSVDELAESEREGVFIVTAKVRDKTGRTDVSKGAVNIQGLKGDALANALMKAETKAKRRATLSICGLGMLDESEVETIPAAVISDSQIHDMEPKQKAGIAWAKDLLEKTSAHERRLTELRKCSDGELFGMLTERWAQAMLPDEPKDWTQPQQKVGLGIAKKTIDEIESREPIQEATDETL